MSKIQQTNRNIGRLLLLLIALLRITTVISVGEQLPVKTYTTGDGLPRDAVALVKQDSRGFIWLIAGDGLSRFDGYKITNYTTDDGLADRCVTSQQLAYRSFMKALQTSAS